MSYEGRPKPVPTGINDVPITRIEKFVSNIKFVPDGCWEWQRELNKGYGYFRVGKSKRLAHRIMWELVGYTVDYDKELHHECENPPCVNPAHLREVTSLENNKFKLDKLYCKRGHLWSENAVPYNNGKRINRRCKACARIRGNAFYAKRKEAATRWNSASMTSSATPDE